MKTMYNIPGIHLSSSTDEGEKGQCIKWYNCVDQESRTSYDRDHELFMRKADCHVLHFMASNLYNSVNSMTQANRVKHAAVSDALHVLKSACEALMGSMIGSDYYGFVPYSQEVLDIATANICLILMVFDPENCFEPPIGYTLLHTQLLELCTEATRRYHIPVYND